MKGLAVRSKRGSWSRAAQDLTLKSREFYLAQAPVMPHRIHNVVAKAVNYGNTAAAGEERAERARRIQTLWSLSKMSYNSFRSQSRPQAEHGQVDPGYLVQLGIYNEIQSTRIRSLGSLLVECQQSSSEKEELTTFVWANSGSSKDVDKCFEDGLSHSLRRLFLPSNGMVIWENQLWFPLSVPSRVNFKLHEVGAGAPVTSAFRIGGRARSACFPFPVDNGSSDRHSKVAKRRLVAIGGAQAD
ncbi:hypothetical protein L218DRAFT_946439 [Marasmius fiardii PR-910]|nr:hypothetical protein L218DRAFT_946439 [Marasmius fiardii PR-910]